MDEEVKAEKNSKPPAKPAATPSPADKGALHRERILRTTIACFMGILAGIVSYIVAGDMDPITGTQPKAVIGWLLMLAAIISQKYVFMLVKIDFIELKAKDWFYQGFMTFAFWIISWTLLLSIPPALA